MKYDLTTAMGFIMVIAFIVNVIVQLTKSYIPIPSKFWCILVSFVVNIAVLIMGISLDILFLSPASVILSIFGSFIIAYIAMFGFDTFKSLWERFRKGEQIYDDN